MGSSAWSKVCCYYFAAHSDTWSLATECYPFALRVPAMMEVLQPFAAVTWASVPLALHLVMATPKISAFPLRGGASRMVRAATGTSTQTSPAAKTPPSPH